MKQFILIIVLISFFDMFSQLPIMSPFAKSLGASPAFIGLIVGMYSFSNMFGNILAGYWIDKQGGKKVLLFGFPLTAAILLLYTIVTTPGQLMAVRFFHGLFSGFLVPAAFTVLANRETESKQGKSMAISGVAVGISAIIGPAFGGIVASKYNVEWVFIIIACAMLLIAGCSAFILPNRSVTLSSKVESSFYTLFSILKTPVLAFSFIGAFSLMFAQGVLAYMLPLQVESLNYGTHFSGMLLSTFGITAILIFGLPTNRIFDKYPHHHTMVLGMTIIGFALILLSNAASLPYLFICMILYGAGFAFLFPSISAMLVEQTDEETRGKAFGLFYAFFSLGVVAGSSLTGILSVSFSTGFIIAACLLFANSIWIFIYFKRKAALHEGME
ncbi:MFS transporter [Cytobacillus solani]|uniref:Bicyclomycin resistance protein n=1 Tax=Cytobacillus solani TaxID=1637975 RepID=A0A0Q3QRH0_9BACI|nr:MFS transporter [Cytobacillus solani]KOP83181.1 bicyclomycin resistance protein [Bacillus sp. FJAT-21945]KQL20208.1 bicyclomycin resistance protein [Cytobacillus solani]USK53461.1 MFS transporter [Cytobacillus solani]